MRQMLLLLLVLSLPAFAVTKGKSAALQGCVEAALSGHRDIGGRPIVYMNKDIEARMKAGVTADGVKETILHLIENDAYDIPVDENGFVPAANVGNHAGNYGRYIWLRDLARAYQGLSAYIRLLEEVSKVTNRFDSKLAGARAKIARMGKAMVKILGNPQWTEAAIANIRNPGRALDPADGFRNVIWIRLMMQPFIENRAPTREENEEQSRWSHKQNDGLGAFAFAILDALDRGHISERDLTIEARRNLAMLPAYFSRMQYWKMWDAGAWEELTGLRASSVGVVVGFLERLQDYPGLDVDFPPELVDIEANVENARRDIEVLIQNGYHVLREQLFKSSRLAEVMTGNEFAKRGADSALFHILWTKLDDFSVADRVHILENLRTLERPSGYVRYEDDLFLNGAAEAAHNFASLRLRLAIPNGAGAYRPALGEDMAEILRLHRVHMDDKNAAPFVAVGGRGLEAGWTFFDSMAGVEYAKLCRETREQKYCQEALRHFQRSVAQVTGHQQLTSEGQYVAAFRWPEAYIPMRYIDGGVVRTRYYASPNSPLNWSTAESALMSLEAWLIAVGQ